MALAEKNQPMPTYWSQSLIPTLRELPAEAEVPSHQLMLRAGFIRKLGAGIYDYLPLGYRSLLKAIAIVRQEMNAAGAIEVFLPTLVPLEFFAATGRDAAYGDNLFRLKDRHAPTPNLALGPTHEEVITEMVAGYVSSYKQLPLNLYQIQTKFRDEYRPRFGILRSREFQMKDAYSFHVHSEGSGGLNETYDKMYAAYCNIFRRCGLPYLTVEAESGPIGGSASHEFMVPSPTGEDTILVSDKGNYAANVEKCAIGPRPSSESFAPLSAAVLPRVPAQPPKGELAKIPTPGCPGIDDVCAFFKKNLGSKLKPSNMLKTLVCGSQETGWVLAIVRGDHDLNAGKLQAACGVAVPLADEKAARAAGFAIGFVGPQVAVGRQDVQVIIDPDAAIDQFWVTGANEVDHHVKGFHWQRDLLDPLGGAAEKRVMVADIRNAGEGDPSPKNDGGVLHTQKGIEIGHVFKLGDKYTKAMNFTILGPNQQRTHPIMGCYGIGVNRILAAAIERSVPGKTGSDANGIIWPAAIAPYQVVITTVRHEGQAKQVAGQLAAGLETAGVDVLIDDRDERAGVKFKDADLIGFPLRITIGDKALAEGKVEIKPRAAAQADLVPVDQVVAKAVELLKTL